MKEPELLLVSMGEVLEKAHADYFRVAVETTEEDAMHIFCLGNRFVTPTTNLTYFIYLIEYVIYYKFSCRN